MVNEKGNEMINEMRLPCNNIHDVLLDFFLQYPSYLGQNFHLGRAPRHGWDNQRYCTSLVSSYWDLEKTALSCSKSTVYWFYTILFNFNFLYYLTSSIM